MFFYQIYAKSVKNVHDRRVYKKIWEAIKYSMIHV